jgi:hypothetical protein
MNWRDGIWSWVMCKLGVHAPLATRYARFLEQSSALAGSQPDVPSVPDQDGPINHRRVTSVPRVPDSRSRGVANARVSSAAPSGRLRCQRCCGTRSRTYHCRHCRDPIAYPAIGVCSRRRTGCANAKILKQRSTVDGDTMDRSIAELPG